MAGTQDGPLFCHKRNEIQIDGYNIDVESIILNEKAKRKGLSIILSHLLSNKSRIDKSAEIESRLVGA